MERDFKGIWIPKEIWLNPALSVTEKCLLVEIDSLDNDPEKGCFASNEYLATFLSLSEGRVANMISDLRNRGHIFNVFFDGRNRGLRIAKENNLHENVKAAFTKTLKQPSRKREHNNTVINTDSKENVQNDVLPAPFDNFWQLFGYKKNRKKAESAFNHLPKYKQALCVEKIPAYLAFIAATNTPQMHPTTWINGERWDDDFTIPANGKKIVNTDAALKDADLPKELQAGYAAYISGMIEKFPALWKSECRVLSQMEWAVFQGDHLSPAQRIALTPQGAAKLRGDVHRVLNQDNFKRAKYTRVYDAIMAAYRAACAGETSGNHV